MDLRALGLLHLIGILCIVMGLVWMWRGDRVLPVKGGIVLRIFSPADGRWARYMKWPMGAALVCVGVVILFK